MFPVPLPPHILALAAEFGIRPQSIIERFVRGGGHGGQKINKTSSTVFLKHIPTGIEVKCQRFREQYRNRIAAYALLIRKIEERIRGKESERANAVFKIRKQKARRSRKAKEKMLREKKMRGRVKELREHVTG